MSPTDILNAGAAGLAPLFARGELTPPAVTAVYLARIARLDPHLRAFISLDAPGAVAAAETSATRHARGEPLSALDGVPVAIKDNIAVAGLPCTAGVAGRRQAVATEDSAAVARLRAAGAVVLGTLNLHEGALGATTDNPTYGRCVNPWSRSGAELTPGGSSGGSGAAVAAGLCALALGTDTMGSVRIPAAYCGVAGFKPSRGQIPREGLAFLSWTLDDIGPLARSVADLCLAMQGLGGWLPAAATRLRGRRVGVMTAASLGTTAAPGLEMHLERAVEALRQAGVEVVPFDPTAALAEPAAQLRRAGLLVCEAEGAVMFAAELAEPAALSADFRRLLTYGAEQPAARLAGAHWRLTQARARFGTALTEAGLSGVISLTAPQTAFEHASPAPTNQADMTCLANLCDLPAASVPVGLSEAGLPVGVQVMGAPGSDVLVLALAALIERALPPPRPLPFER